MSDKAARQWLKPFLNPLKPTFREVLFMSAFVNLMALAVPIFTMQTYDRVIASSGFSTLIGFVLGMIAVLIFDYVLRQARSRILQTVALRIDVMVGRKLFEKLMEVPLSTLEAKPANYWQSLFRDVDVVRNTLSGASALLLADLPFAFMFLGLILVIALPVAWVLLIILPLFMIIAWRSAGAMAEANEQERESTLNRDGLIAEMISGRTTIKALALDGAMRPHWEQKHAENIANAITRGAKSDFYSSFGGTLTMLTTVMMTGVGAVMIIDGVMTMGSLIATNMLSGRLIGPLNQLVGQWRSYNSFKQSVERLGEVFDGPSDRTESEINLERPKGHIEVENVTFSYAEELAPVVDQVVVNIHSLGIHALVGRNGSGKTTLLKVIQGLYTPTIGRVMLDGADIAQFSRAELARWMGYVPQECVLFAGTVRDNIAHRIPNSTDDEIIKAATEAGVHSFIIDLPDGYATEIGEAGSRLSGGQRQRISIARALLGDPPVLLLDEPSSSLDRQAEQALRKTLIDIGKERTVIIVTHSPILLAACQDLVALDKGKVALAGPAKDILPQLFGKAPKTGSANQQTAAAKPRAEKPVQQQARPQQQQARPQQQKSQQAKPSPASAPKKLPTAQKPTKEQAQKAPELNPKPQPGVDPSVAGANMFKLDTPDVQKKPNDPYADLVDHNAAASKQPTK